MGRTRAGRGGSPCRPATAPSTLPRNRLFSSLSSGPFPRRAGAGGCGGVARCRVLGRCALGSGPPPLSGRSLPRLCSRLLDSVRGVGAGAGCGAVAGGFGRVGCELHSGREHQECFFVVVLVRRPLGALVCPPRSFVGRGGWGSGGRVCAARHRVGWAGPSAVRAPVSDVRFVVVCCVLFVDF